MKNLKKIKTLLFYLFVLVFNTSTLLAQKNSLVEFYTDNLVKIPADSFSFRCKKAIRSHCSPERTTEHDIQWLFPDSISKVWVDEFYISKYEVSNLDYLTYLHYLSKKSPEKHSGALPDTLVGRELLRYCDPYVDYYLRHPAYRDFPLVGITPDQADKFCIWLTGLYNQSPKRKFNKVFFRLPRLEEWAYAASGKNEISHFGWEGKHLMKNDELLANFLYVPQIAIKENENNIDRVNDGYENYETSPVKSYKPNAFGLYNMQGNVSELIFDRNISMGGSFSSTGFYLQNFIYRSIEQNSPSSQIGFRIVMEVLEK